MGAAQSACCGAVSGHGGRGGGVLPSNGTEVHDAQAVARECQKMTPKDVMHAATVVICGDGAVGKTCVFNRSFEAVQDAEAEKRAGTLAAQNFDPTDQEYEPTIFEDYSGQAVDVCGHLKGLPALDEAITVTLRDTAGQEAYDAINDASFQDVDVFILAFALRSDSGRFNTTLDNIVDKWLPKARKCSPNAKFLLVGTMKDYNPVDYSPGTPARIKIDNAARQIGTKFIATSAKELNPGGNCKNAVDIACLLALFPELRTA